MKFTCLQENLREGLSTVSKAVATKGSLPVLSHVLITTEDNGRLKLSATNLETSIITWIPATITEAGAISVPARLISEVVSNLPATEIEAFLEKEIFYLKTAAGKSKFNGLSAEEFPSLPAVPADLSLTIDPKAFAKAVSEVVFAASSDDARPILGGILLKAEGNDLVLVGVDGFRLAERRLSLPEPITLEPVVISAKALLEVARLVGSGTSPLSISIEREGNLAAFSGENFLIITRLLEGEFPDYLRIIPKDFKTKSTFSKEEFLKAARLSSIFARDASNIIKVQLDGSKSQITLSAITAEVGESTVAIPATISGDDLIISFNGKYLLDLMNNTSGDNIILETTGALAPGLWRLDDRVDYLHLIMPVKVAS
ncbi:MAG: DNA polymerase III subunit beta [candidate division WWE3 bacterium]|nr:DNA polymerase III subunit beta [candidate division WWE3 bacterium]